MKRNTIPALNVSLLLLGTAVLSEPGLAATITASSCSQTAVQSAISSAADGDVVSVPAGSCTWSAAVSVNKPITLKGAGATASGTKITYGGTGHPLINIDPGNKTGYVGVSGFWLVGGDSNNWNGNAIVLNGPSGWKNVRIHENVFENNYPWTMFVSGSTHGLIDNNTFRGRAYGMKVYGNGARDWSTPLTLGTADFLFVENNAFEYDDFYGSTGVPAVDMNNGGRVVFRNNKLTHSFFETHDKARSGLVSANAYEIYNNTFAAGTNKWKGVDLTAGTGVVWGNTFTGDWTIPIGAMDYKTFDPRSVKRCDGNDPADQNVAGESGWRCQYQIGTQGEGASAVSYPLYVWSNTKNGQAAQMQCSDGCTHIKSGRDYINNGTTPKAEYKPFQYPHPLVINAPRPKPPADLSVQ